MKKITILISFILYWLFTILNLIINKGEIATFIFYLCLFFPLTIAIIKEYDVFALFIILLYEVAECFMNLMGVASILSDFDSSYIMLCVTQFITSLFAFSMLNSCIKILRNKDNILTWSIIILGSARCLFTLINFIIVLVNKVGTEINVLEQVFDLLCNVLFVVAITLYIAFFEKKEIKLFIKEQ